MISKFSRIYLLLLAMSCGHWPAHAAANNYTSKIRGILSHYLKDPLSAQIRIAAVKADAICGVYNSKNGFGGYVGFKPFTYEPSSGDLFLAGTVIRKSGLVEDAVAMVEYHGSDFAEFGRRAAQGKGLMQLTETKLRGCENA